MTALVGSEGDFLLRYPLELTPSCLVTRVERVIHPIHVLFWGERYRQLGQMRRKDRFENVPRWLSFMLVVIECSRVSKDRAYSVVAAGEISSIVISLRRSAAASSHLAVVLVRATYSGDRAR